MFPDDRDRPADPPGESGNPAGPGPTGLIPGSAPIPAAATPR
ncbi:MAG: hypothetical protein HW391_178 [Chloroflexi bacterium]|nr:hypothetical protein [Chloroflexota bacterium]